MVSLREALENEKDAGPSKRLCSIGSYIKALNPDDRKAFINALDDKTLSAISITRAVLNTGTKLSHEVLARHRRRFCKCGEDAWNVIR